MPPSPADMLLFSAVVREGGFSAAARRLGLSKQHLSQRVARLEEDLGVRLLERSTRSLRPTEAGLAYHEQVSRIEGLIQEANEGARLRSERPSGPLRVTAPTLLGRRLLGPVIVDFVQRFPEVRLELALLDRRVDLLAEGFDLAVRTGELDDSSLAARRLGDAELAWVASPALLARGEPTVTDLHSWPILGMRDPEVWELGGRRITLRPRMVVDDLELLCAAAEAGLGVARLPLLACGAALEAGRLRRTLGEAGRAPVHAIFPSRSHLPARVRLFVEALAERLLRGGG